MQIIDILGNNLYLKLAFQPGNGPVTCIGFDFGQLPPPLVIECQHALRVLRKALGGRNLHDIVSFPQSSGIPESADTTFRTHARTT